uniref:(California timema) hypothetical protein n=1 Tax=Timema californicum TaxID=61474 RepID=A0A7R9IWD4_TIMCA|nr:unnamed protein product [Timema californicum]
MTLTSLEDEEATIHPEKHWTLSGIVVEMEQRIGTVEDGDIEVRISLGYRRYFQSPPPRTAFHLLLRHLEASVRPSVTSLSVPLGRSPSAKVEPPTERDKHSHA